jgi:glyoxylase-like metal-dependent hydrolase (beta-lactamase superfamily II)
LPSSPPCSRRASVAPPSDACDSYVPAVTGGPILPESSDIALLRWLANANYELSYRGRIFLFDTYFDRKARTRPVGFSAAQVTKADVIFLGHGHFDHMSDAVPVAKQTGAPVVGAPVTIETAIRLGLPPKQAITVQGGETLHFGDVTVDVALAHHSQPPPRVLRQRRMDRRRSGTRPKWHRCERFRHPPNGDKAGRAPRSEACARRRRSW